MSIQILLSTYNGEKYLEEQIESLRKQVGVDFSIFVRDDGSTDNTKSILEKYAKEGALIWYDGENIKPAHSFFDLMKNASEFDYYAFCDQDDVWANNKLFMAIEKLNKCEVKTPSMYFSRAQLVDERLNTIKSKNYPKDKFTFGTALIRNNVTGCTMVFNKTLLELVNHYNPKYLSMHDHWIYVLCLALNGNIIYDANSYIKYRQHESNACGADNSLINRFKKSGFSDKNKIRYNIAVQLYDNYLGLIPKENTLLLEKIIKYHNSMYDKFNLIFDRQIKAHSLLSDMSLIINILKCKL